jgi:hypothetical protein
MDQGSRPTRVCISSLHIAAIIAAIIAIMFFVEIKNFFEQALGNNDVGQAQGSLSV